MLKLSELSIEEHYDSGLEAIAVQKDTAVVDEIKKVVSMVRAQYESKAPASKIDLTKYCFDLEEIITKRFGFKTKIDMPNEKNSKKQSYAGCMTVGFDTGGGLIDVNTLVRNVKKLENVSDLNKKFLDNIGVLDSFAKFNAIYIDEDKAKISNLPKDFEAIITINFNEIFNPRIDSELSKAGGITDEEITAIILHEVGHVFTLLSYAYKTRASRITFEDVLRDQQKKGSEPKKQIIMAYKEAYDKNLDLKEFNNKSTVQTAFICIKKRFDRYKFDGSKRASTDAEFAADQFVSRFGLGEPLGRALRKLSIGIDPIIIGSMADIDIYDIVVFLFSIWALATISAVLAFVVGGTTMAMLICGLLVILGIWYVSYNYINLMARSLYSVSGRVYDNDIRRIERISNDIVRQIRTQEDRFSKEQLESMLQQVERIDAIVEHYKAIGMECTNIPTNKFFEFFSSNYASSKALEELDVVMESLMENRLHTVSKQFK